VQSNLVFLYISACKTGGVHVSASLIFSTPDQFNQERRKPLAALVDAQLFDCICQFKDRFDNLSQRISEAYADVPPEEGMAEIDAIVSDIRHP